MDHTPIEVFVNESQVYQKLTGMRILFNIQLETYEDGWRMVVFDGVSQVGTWRDADLLALVNQAHKEAFREYRDD